MAGFLGTTTMHTVVHVQGGIDNLIIQQMPISQCSELSLSQNGIANAANVLRWSLSAVTIEPVFNPVHLALVQCDSQPLNRDVLFVFGLSVHQKTTRTHPLVVGVHIATYDLGPATPREILLRALL